MTINLKSFAEVLASMQGGVRLKPGRSYKTVLTEAQVLEIFGEIPTARAGYGVMFNLKQVSNGEFEVTVRLTS